MPCPPATSLSPVLPSRVHTSAVRWGYVSRSRPSRTPPSLGQMELIPEEGGGGGGRAELEAQDGLTAPCNLLAHAFQIQVHVKLVLRLCIRNATGHRMIS